MASKKVVQKGSDSDMSGEARSKTPSKPSLLKRLWAKTGLTLSEVIRISKGAATPVIALSLIQWAPFVNYFTSLCFLVAIAAILSMTIQSRAKFVQSMIYNVLGICVGAAINVLTCYCAVKAREHTTPVEMVTSNGPASGSQTAQYNSSASAVAGIWLFFNIMVANAVRFKYPQLQIPVILYSINANVGGIYAPQLPNMPAAEAFVKKLLLTFLSGFAIGTVMNLIVFPVSSRSIAFDEINGYIGAIKSVLAAERDYMQSMESGPLRVPKDTNETKEDPIAAATKKLKGAAAGLTAIHGKLSQDLVFAKRDAAWGKLTAKDLDQIFKLLRAILMPTLGLTSVADIFERVAEGRGWSESPHNPEVNKRADSDPKWKSIVEDDQKHWNELMKILHDPFQKLVEAMTDGLTHATYALELAKPPKSKVGMGSSRSTNGNSEDVEAKAGGPASPGDENFGEELRKRVLDFTRTNDEALVAWCDSKGLAHIEMSAAMAAHVNQVSQLSPDEHDRRHLFMILYMEFLLWSTAKGVWELVRFADEKVKSGQMNHSKLMFPGVRRLKKWLLDCLKPEDSTSEHTPDSAGSGYSNVSVEGEATGIFGRKKDPEHLPPTNVWQHLGEKIRIIPRALASHELAMGFRVAVATMSIAIMGFLHQTQAFFIRERVFWAQIMVAIGMSMTSGSGTFGFALRILGTFIAAIVSLVLWYIAGGRGIPGAVLPLLFLAYLPELYLFLKNPRFTPVFMVLQVTQVLILGYQFEVQKLSIATIELNGQNYHPIYIFAWVRLATVVAGVSVAFIFTYFPYPLTAKNAMRTRLGDSIYLLAGYYSCVHTSIGFRLSGGAGNPNHKNTPAHQLRKQRYKYMSKILNLLTQIRTHLSFTKFELHIGGKFPKERYDEISTLTNNVFNYIALIDYATASYDTTYEHPSTIEMDKNRRGSEPAGEDGEEQTVEPAGAGSASDGQGQQAATADSDGSSSLLDHKGESARGPNRKNNAWLADLARVRGSISVTSHEITSVLTLMASSIKGAQPLPPFMQAPRPYLLTQRIHAIDPDVLSVRHVTERGYAAFAVTQVATRLISTDMKKLLDNVRALVGEVDFSFHPDGKAMHDKHAEKGKGD